MLTYIGPDGGQGSPSLVVTQDDLGDASLGQFAAMQDAAIRAGFTGIEVLEDCETTVAGHPAVRRTYRWTLEGRTMRQRMWCVVHDGVGYSIVATAPDDEFDGMRATFAAALRGFRIDARA